ncbi:MAG: chorismate synthase [Victivallales bacterium]|nr:chorismate synthase [Victivallales bacterium]
MANSFGKNLRVQIFGESHGTAIGCTIDGLPPGFRVDHEALQRFLDRRAPGNSSLATARKETDTPEFLAGIREDGTLTGATLCAIIRNADHHSADYSKLHDCPRPGHADYTAALRFRGYNDVRGGGIFSGRLTAPLCIAGGISLQVLENQGVMISSRIAELAGVPDQPRDPENLTGEVFRQLDGMELPTLGANSAQIFAQLIRQAREQQDSVGGVVECFALGFPAGLGNPRFDGLKNRLAQVLFGIPATVGVEFGDGFTAARRNGSQNNDPYEIAQDGTVRTTTNHCGGILGGISTGMPIRLRVAFKPTPSIAREQDSISLSRKEGVKLAVTGRHDPCVVPRAVPVVTAAVALVLLDFLMERTDFHGFNCKPINTPTTK